MTFWIESPGNSMTDILSPDGGESLFIADDCNDVQWITPKQAADGKPVQCDTCHDQDPTWRKVYVRA